MKSYYFNQHCIIYKNDREKARGKFCDGPDFFFVKIGRISELYILNGKENSMKKISLAVLTICVACLFLACGPSALEIKEKASACEFNVEVRYVQDDSVGIFVGNTLYLSTSQLASGRFYPLLVSSRDPMNIDGRAPTDVVNSDEEFAAYINRRVPGSLHFGIVLSDNVGYEIGFDSDAAVKALRNFFEKSYPGSTAVLFRERGGDLISAEKLY